jgi:hypothetical protein
MIASFVQIFIESVQRAFFRQDTEVVELSPIGMATMLATIGVKSVLWFWCSRIPSSGVQALAQDAENDVWLNVMSLSFPWLGAKLGWRLLDPIGGMVLSAYIVSEWVKTLLQNFANRKYICGRGETETLLSCSILNCCTVLTPSLRQGRQPRSVRARPVSRLAFQPRHLDRRR